MEPLELTIDSLSNGAAGIGRTPDGVVMVPGTVPGDVVRVEVTATHRGYREASLLEVVHPSPHRRTPPCPHVPECGGCTWQHVSLEAQRSAKESSLRRELHRAGIDLDGIDLRPIRGTAEWGYRHRVRFRVDAERRFGFYQYRTHRLVEIDRCAIADSVVNDHLDAARLWLARARTTVRRLEIASSADGRVAFFANAEGAYAGDDEVHRSFLAESPTISGIVLFGKAWRLEFGDPEVRIELADGLSLRARGAFTQVNLEGNRFLVDLVRSLVAPRPETRVLDLYCGAGNLALPLAREALEVVGADVDRVAIAAAERNAAAAGFTNARFLRAGARRAVRRLAREGARFSVVLLDPPRAGALEVLEALPELEPERIVYVSCNPATLARDLARLGTLGFRVVSIDPLDLFPQTHHLETVTLLERRTWGRGGSPTVP